MIFSTSRVASSPDLILTIESGIGIARGAEASSRMEEKPFPFKVALNDGVAILLVEQRLLLV